MTSVTIFGGLRRALCLHLPPLAAGRPAGSNMDFIHLASDNGIVEAQQCERQSGAVTAPKGLLD